MTAVRFLPAAELELLKETTYYSRSQNETGLRFQAGVEAAIELAVRHPMGGAPSHAGTRSMRVKGFPLSVIYRQAALEFLVVAIAPHRKHAQYWVQRVDQS